MYAFSRRTELFRLSGLALGPLGCRPLTFELGKKQAIALFMPFILAPLLHSRQPDSIVEGDCDGHIETLPVVPVVIGGEAIPARIGGGQREGLGTALASPYGADPEILPDPQWPPRKFDVESDRGMRPMVAIPPETKRIEGTIQRLDGRALRKYEVNICRGVCPSSVEVRARTAGQNATNPRTPERVPHGDSDIGEG